MEEVDEEEDVEDQDESPMTGWEDVGRAISGWRPADFLCDRMKTKMARMKVKACLGCSRYFMLPCFFALVTPGRQGRWRSRRLPTCLCGSPTASCLPGIPSPLSGC